VTEVHWAGLVKLSVCSRTNPFAAAGHETIKSFSTSSILKTIGSSIAVTLNWLTISVVRFVIEGFTSATL
jgi:hypothetical protein